jgi:glycosyltransferase involved in cell wall biosynthesis
MVSVLMTAYNREKYIAEAIESVLASSFKDFELIIVDDCSKDHTVEIARRYTSDPRVQVHVNEKNLGDYPNRNRAASFARGKYLKYLDSDDVIYPHGLEVMVSSMERFPEAVLGLIRSPRNDAPDPAQLSPKEAYVERFANWVDLAGSVSWGIRKCGSAWRHDGVWCGLSKASSGGGSMSNKKSRLGTLPLVTWNGITGSRLLH